MCGLVGYSSKDNFDIEKIKLLLIWNSLERGTDSVGIYTPGKDIYKSLESGRSLFFSKNANYKLESSNLFIGHVRAATIGHKTLNNAHPFKRDNYILAHNGTLTNHKDLIKKYELANLNIEVDSDVVCAGIAKTNNFNILSDIDGAAAFLITDTKNPNVLYAYTNGERPLFKGYIDGNLYISSIEESLVYIGAINIKSFNKNTLYTIANGSILDTKIIKQTPYRDIDSIIKSTIDYQKNNNVRLKDKTNKYYNIVTIELHKGFYIYTLKELSSNVIYTISSERVNIWDILEKSNFAYLKSDIKKTYYHTVEKVHKEAIIPKGTIVEITTVYSDGDVGITDYNTKISYGYVGKHNLVKISKKQISKVSQIIKNYEEVNINKSAITNTIVGIGNGTPVLETNEADIITESTVNININELLDDFTEIKEKINTIKNYIDLYIADDGDIITNELTELEFMIESQEEFYKDKSSNVV